MKKLMWVMLLGLGWVNFHRFAFAQYPPPASFPDPKQAQVQSLILMRLTTSLGLNPQQSQQLGAIMAKYQDRRRQLRQQMHGLTQQLRVISATGNSDQIQATIQKLDQTKAELDRVDDQMFAEAKKMLTPQQQAQFLLVMEDIRREVKAVRGNYGPGFGPGAGMAYPGSAQPTNDSVWVK